MPMVRFQAVTRGDRHAVTTQCKDAIESVGGWLRDSHFYSNHAATLVFALPADAVEPLRVRLAALNLTLETGPVTPGRRRSPDDEIDGTLALTFLHDEPDLRRPIPAVPG